MAKVTALRSRIMASIRSVSSVEEVPECMRGLSLRHSPKGVFGRPDFANKRRKIALFIDGDFWHRNPLSFKMPKSNRRFWKAKILRNVKRDVLVNATLMSQGWRVLRVWEMELRRKAVAGPAAGYLIRTELGRRPALGRSA